MKILVVGAGAVGSLFGVRLAAAGHQVRLIGRPEHVAAIRLHGLRVEGTGPGTYAIDADTEVREDGSSDAVLVTVKTFDLASAASAIARGGLRPVPTLLPQNGLGVEQHVIPTLRSGGWTDPVPWLVRAVNSIPVTWLGPGVIRQAGEGEVVLRDPRVPHPAARSGELFRALLTGAGIPVRLVADLDRELWRKALVNAAINPVTALHRVPNGRLLNEPYREEAHVLLREAQRAASLAGFPFPDAEADRDLERVVRATAENRSSMLQDIERGRPTEVDAISGEIVRVAARHGVSLPATRGVVERLRQARGASAPAQPS